MIIKFPAVLLSALLVVNPLNALADKFVTPSAQTMAAVACYSPIVFSAVTDPHRGKAGIKYANLAKLLAVIN